MDLNELRAQSVRAPRTTRARSAHGSCPDCARLVSGVDTTGAHPWTPLVSGVDTQCARAETTNTVRPDPSDFSRTSRIPCSSICAMPLRMVVGCTPISFAALRTDILTWHVEKSAAYSTYRAASRPSDLKEAREPSSSIAFQRRRISPCRDGSLVARLSCVTLHPSSQLERDQKTQETPGFRLRLRNTGTGRGTTFPRQPSGLGVASCTATQS